MGSEHSEPELPALWKAADDASASNQKSFFNIKRWELGGLAVGAAAALLPGPIWWSVGPFVCVAAFILVLALQAFDVGARAEARWYDARATAESIKSAAWQFAVGGEAFRLSDADAEERFTRRLEAVLAAVPKLDIGPVSGTAAGVTPSMELIRALPLADRISVYRQFRAQDQVRWYARKAQLNRARSRLFKRVIIGVGVVAIAVGVVRFKLEFDPDFLGLLAAICAGLIAWTQAKKYAFLAESYSVTSHEVNLVAATLKSAKSEDEWAQLVHDAEAAFSREHTMWQARRQAPA